MVTGHPNIKMATSIIDYVFRVLGIEYLGRTDLAQVQPELVEDGAPAAHPAADAPAPTATATGGNGHRLTTNGNGHGNGHSAEPEQARTVTALLEGTTSLNMLDVHLSEMMGDAPFCDVCGHITVRNGACYKCLNCGNSLGCS